METEGGRLGKAIVPFGEDELGGGGEGEGGEDR